MRGYQRRRHLGGYLNGHLRSDQFTINGIAYCYAFDELAGDEVFAADFADFMNSKNVGMVQAGCGARLLI